MTGGCCYAEGMPNKQDIIEEKTFPEVETEKRIFYVLVGERDVASLSTPEGMQAHRTAKLLGLLSKHLKDKGLLSNAEIDEMLLQVVL
jgi:hypothetical protein